MAGPIWKTAMETAHQNIPRRGFKLKPNYDPAEVLLFPGAGSVIDGESTIEDELPEGID
jgi:hypothetical protein